MKYFPIILILLLTTLGCKYFKPAQKLASEAAKANAKNTIADSDLWLNNEYAGKISELGREKSLDDPGSLLRPSLTEMLRTISQHREQNGIFIEGTNQVAANVYLGADPLLTVGKIAELYDAIDRNVGEVYIPKLGHGNISHTEIPVVKPNPVFLAVTTRKTDLPAFAGFPIYDPDRKFSYRVSFSFPDPTELKMVRILENSIEISSDDNYFKNMEQPFFNLSDHDDFDVKQLPLDQSGLANAVEETINKNGPHTKEFHIIASEKASYESLYTILEATVDSKVEFKIAVRRVR